MKNIPELSFNNWVKWDERNTIKGINYPGIYMVALSNENLAGTYPRNEDVIYIGMSNALGGLRSRLRQLNSAINAKWGHSGGNEMVKQMGHYSTWDQKLFVATMPLKVLSKHGVIVREVIPGKMGY